MEELKQAVLPRLQAAQFLGRAYAQLCVEMTIRRSPLRASHRFPSFAEISSSEFVQFSLALTQKNALLHSSGGQKT